MRLYGYIIGGLSIAGISFLAGWLVRPGFKLEELPEIGELRLTGKPCPSTTAAGTTVPSIVEQSLSYSPGDSSVSEVLVFRRTADRAALVVLRENVQDDEVSATGEEYELKWTGAGWSIAACRSAIRH